MSGFGGFPSGKQPYTPVPNLFFSEVLPQIDHLGELKLTLYVFWLLARKKSERSHVSFRELESDHRLLQALAQPDLPSREALLDALDRAVQRRTLLQAVEVPGVEGLDLEQPGSWYFLNSERGRQALQDLAAGKWKPSDREGTFQIQAQRPNIFVLYEQHVGPLSPLLAEELMEAETTYPAPWIEDAFREAVELNKRSWRYIERILERWAAEGKEDETSRRGDERNRRRFIEGEYADFVEH